MGPWVLDFPMGPMGNRGDPITRRGKDMQTHFSHKVFLIVFTVFFCYFTTGTADYAESQNAKILTEGNTYRLTCNKGTITIYFPSGSFDGISAEQVWAKWTEHNQGKDIEQSGWKDKVETQVDNILCEPLKKSSVETTVDTTKEGQAVSIKKMTKREAGKWICKGENVEFTIRGFLARRRDDGTWDTSGANSLNWIIEDSQKCDFMID